MTLETPLILEATGADAPISYDAYNLRTLMDAVWSSEGVISLTDLVVTQRAAGANMSVDVSAGTVIIKGDAIANQGKYVCRSTAVTNLTITTAPGTGSRTDLIVAQLYDKQADGGTQYSWTPLVVTGSTTAPASSVVLAQVVVPAGTASITTASNINGTGRQYATLPQLTRPTYQAQVSQPTWTGVTFGSLQNFASGNWPAFTFTVPPSGQVWVSIYADMKNTNTSSSNIQCGWTVTSGSLTIAGGATPYLWSGGGGWVAATKRVLCTGTPGASVTITPQYQLSDANASTGITWLNHGILSAEMVP